MPRIAGAIFGVMIVSAYSMATVQAADFAPVAPSPSTICTVNWLTWTPGPDDGSLVLKNDFNPTKYGFIETTDGWWRRAQEPSHDRQRRFVEAGSQSLPLEGGEASEAHWGRFVYQGLAGSTFSKIYREDSAIEIYALRLLDSDGNQLARYPSGDHTYNYAGGGTSYPAADEAGRWVDISSSNDQFPDKVAASQVAMSATIPADGLVYVEILILDPNKEFGIPSLESNRCLAFDSSDAPADGSTAPDGGVTVYGSAVHYLSTGVLRLGIKLDMEESDLSSTGASGDDTAGSDDEDGVTFPVLAQGRTATIPVNTSGAGGYLQGWVDWNGDGDFHDAGEQIAEDLQDSGTGTINIPVSVPAVATSNQTFARFRWSTVQGLDSTVAAPDGEVEDYAVTINDLLPVASPDTGTYTSKQPGIIDVLANDTTGDTIDPTTVVFTATGTPSGTLSPDGKVMVVTGEGVWRLDATTGVVTFTPEANFIGDPTPPTYTGEDAQGNISGEASITLTVAPFQSCATGFTTMGYTLENYTKDVAADTSSVEIHHNGSRVGIVSFEPETGRPNMLSNSPNDIFNGNEVQFAYSAGPYDERTTNGVRVTITPDAGGYLNGAIRINVPGTGDSFANEEGQINYFDFGSSLDGLPVKGVLAETEVSHTNATTGDIIESNITRVTRLTRAEIGVTYYYVDFGFDATDSQPYSVVFYEERATQQENFSLSFEGLAQTTDCSIPVTDYSDAPADGSPSPVSGTTAYGEARHDVVSGIRLGVVITDETSAAKDKDNASDDGIVIPTLMAGDTAAVTISAADITGSGVGTLHAWIDFNGNGLFDTVEHATIGFNNGATGNLVFSGYGTTMVAGTTYARFRLTSNTLNSADFATVANDGEVEDYAITVDLFPVTTPDTTTYTPAQPATVNVLANDTTGDTVVPATVSLVGGTDTDNSGTRDRLVVANEGTWTVNATTGALTFTPKDGFTGNPTPVKYTVRDVQGNTSNEAAVSLAADPLPVTTPDATTYTPARPATVNVLANDSTGDTVVPATVSLVGGTDTDNNGTRDRLVVADEGIWTVNATTGALTFTPKDGFTGNPTPVKYTVEDVQGNTSNEAAVSLAADPLPVTTPDTTTYTPAQPATVNVLANDSTGDTVVPATVSLVGGTDTDNNGTRDRLVVANEGTWTVNTTTGALTFTPKDGFTGNPTPVKYTVRDTQGNTSNEAAVSLAADPLPVTTPDTTTYTPAQPVTVNVLANDTSGDTVVPATMSLVGGTDTDNNGTQDRLVVANEGTWTVNTTTGALTFTPKDGFTGNPTPVKYTVEDTQGNVSNEAAVSLAADPLPVTTPDTTTYTPAQPATVNVLANDSTGDTVVPATVSLVGGTDTDNNGTRDRLVVADEGTWTVDATTGALTFTPKDGFTGNPTPVKYTVEDTQGNVSNEAAVSLAADPLPVTTPDTTTYTPAQPATVNVLANDSTGDTVVPATVSLVGGTDTDSNGARDTLVVANEGTWTVDATTGALTFTPQDGFTGNPTPVKYTVEDTQGNVSNEAAVSLAADPLPVTTPDTTTYTPAQPATVNVLANDSTGDTVVPATVSLVGGTDTDNNGTRDRLVVADEGTWTVNTTTGALTFTPKDGFTGNPTPVKYTVRDTQGNTSNEAAVSLAADPLPVTTPDTTTYTPAQPATVNVLANDTTGDTVVPATVSLVGGTDTDNNGTRDRLVVANEGTWTVNATTGALTFTPKDGFTGNPTPVKYTVEDTQGNVSNEAAVSLAADPLPVTTPDTTTYTPAQPATVNVLANDSTGDTVVPATVSLVGGTDTDNNGTRDRLVVADEGTWTVNATTGALIFTPKDGFTGNPTPVKYTVRDVQGNTSNEAVVSLAADPLPVAIPDTTVYTPAQPATVNVLANDTSGDTVVPATVSLMGGTDTDNNDTPDTLVVANEGTWTVDATTGALTFTPQDGFTGDPTPVNYTVEDTQGNVSNEALVTLAADPLPVATPDTVAYTPAQPVTVSVLANDSTGDTVVAATVSLTGGTDTDGNGTLDTLVMVNEGTWIVDATTGALIFIPEGDFTDSPTPVKYTVQDAQGNPSNEVTVTLTADLLPIAIDDTATYVEGMSKTVSVMANDTTGDTIISDSIELTGGTDSDGDGTMDELMVIGEGSWKADPVSGTVTFTPIAGFTGDPTPVSYTGKDAEGNVSNEATITLTMDSPTGPTGNPGDSSGSTDNSPQNIPAFGPFGLLAMLTGLFWLGRSRQK